MSVLSAQGSFKIASASRWLEAGTDRVINSTSTAASPAAAKNFIFIFSPPSVDNSANYRLLRPQTGIWIGRIKRFGSMSGCNV